MVFREIVMPIGVESVQPFRLAIKGGIIINSPKVTVNSY